MEKQTYRIKNSTHSGYEAADSVEQEALISIMRELAEPFGFTVLTYSLRSGNLSSLVSAPPHDQLLAQFQNAFDQKAGKNESKLLERLQKLYSKAQIEKFKANLEAFRARGEDITPLIKQFTNNIGDPVKYAEAINEAFICWIQKHRPKLYSEYEEGICHELVSHTQVSDMDGLQDTAAAMDYDAVNDDDALAEQKYRCGYADALRGNQQALIGLCQLIGKPASGVTDAKKLGYKSWLEQINFSAPTKQAEPEPQDRSAQKKEPEPPQKTKPKQTQEKPSQAETEVTEKAETVSAKPLGSLIDSDEPGIVRPSLATLDAPVQEEQTSKSPLHPVVKFALLAIVLLAIGGGIFTVMNQSEPVTTTTKDETTKPPPEEAEAPEETQAPTTPQEQAKADKLKKSMRLLYGPTSSKLATAFCENSSIKERLQMSRNTDTVTVHISSYSNQALYDRPVNLVSSGVAYTSGILYERYNATFVDGSSRLLCVVATPDGLRIDWDSYARYCSAKWPDIKNGIVKSATVRVRAKQAYHYKSAYQDEGQWLCCELTSPDFEGSLYAYALRGTTTAKILEQVLPRPESDSSEQVTLKISSSEGGHKLNQFTIDRIQAASWVLGDKDVEQTWIFADDENE